MADGRDHSLMGRGVLLDIAGVVTDGASAIGGAPEAVGRLRAAGMPAAFLTNTTRTPKREIVARLASVGIPVAEADVLTPAGVACDWLRRAGRAPHLLVHPDLEPDFAELSRAGAPAVIVGDAGPFFTYARLNAAFREIEAGAPFLALAANRVFRDTDGALSLDAGAFVRALEFASGREAQVLGKPAEAFFHAAARRLGCAPGAVTMVGDDAESDVAGALRAGLGAAILVRTGKYRTGDEARVAPGPSAVVPSLTEAVEAILADGGA
jgi:HAD superfamily hydrolase (TIGR01458 family)